MLRSRAVALAAVLAALPVRAGSAHADGAHAVSKRRRAAAIATAIGPGLVVHGAGSYVLGDRPVARHLAVTGAVGLGAMVVAGLVIGQSGGSAYTIPAVPVALLGAGLFVPTWAADIAHAAGVTAAVGTPRALPPYSLEVGTVFLHDPYRQRGLGELAGTVELGRLELGATGIVDSEGDQHTEALAARYRVLGASTTGDRLAIDVALRHRGDPDDGTRIDTAEIAVGVRAELRHLDPALAGQFLEGSAGIGVEHIGFTHDETDTNSILLGGFAYGLYLGHGSEVALAYDHRRDGMVGGIAAWRAAGFVGSVGARALVRVAPHWLVHGELQIGNAWVTTVGLRYEGGR